MFLFQASQLLVDPGQARRGGRRLVAQSGQRGARSFQAGLGVPAGLPRRVFLPHAGSRHQVRLPLRLRRLGCFLFGGGKIPLQPAKAIALAQPDRGGRRGARANRIAVPTPDGAFSGHQDLAGCQMFLAVAGERLVLDQTDLRQGATQGGRALGQRRQGAGAIR